MVNPHFPTRGGIRRAFTIIELIIALVIGALVATAVSTSLSQLGRAREVARLHMTASRRATDALEFIRRDVQSILRSDDLFNTRFRLAAESKNSSVGVMDRDQLLLFSERLRPMRPLNYTGEGQEYETQYRIEEDNEGFALWRRRDAVPDQYEDAGGVAEPVGEGVVALRFEAYDGSSWRQDWDSDTDGLPWSVRATVTASGAKLGADPFENARSLVTMRTEIPMDRSVPPKSDAPSAAAEGDTSAGDAAAGDGAAGGGAVMPDGGSGQGGGQDIGQGGGGGRGGKGQGAGQGAGQGGKANGNPYDGGMGPRGGGNVPFRPPPNGSSGGGRGNGGGGNGPSRGPS